MSNQETYETIEAYLSGNLTGTDLKDFEARLQSDKNLSAQVLLFQEMDAALREKPVLDFQKMVRLEGADFLQGNDAEEAVIKRIGWSRRYLAIAASLLVLLVSALIFWKIQSVSPPSGKELFAQNFETYALNERIRSEETTSDSAFQSGIQQYQAKDFVAAARTFQKLLVSNDQDMVLIFCLGNALLNQQPPQFDLAEQQFQKIIKEGESIYVPRAQWYQALIFLEKGDVLEAKNLLKEVAKIPDNFGRKAGDLLDELGA